jgi:PIN domain nuclease of toxin-antitoxin system
MTWPSAGCNQFASELVAQTMKLLLDTHVSLWWLKDDPRLRSRVRAIIADQSNTALVSVASCWEPSIKFRKAGIGDAGSRLWHNAIAQGFEILAITSSHLEALEALPFAARHDDPFDHLILSQAKAEDAVIITHDRAMTAYGVPCIGVR